MTAPRSDLPLPFWTDERVAELRRLYASGLSCSQAAKVLGHGVSRNAALGRLHRLHCPCAPASVKPAQLVGR